MSKSRYSSTRRIYAEFAEKYPEQTGETNTKPSLTIPDQALSLREMLERFVRGGEVERFNPVYHDEEEIVPDNWERMTQQERMDYAAERGEELQEKVREMKKPKKAVVPEVVEAVTEE